MAALERDAGFCSGEDEELEDASEDSVEVRVQPVAGKSKRKSAEPRRFGEEAKRRLVDYSRESPFRPWSQAAPGYPRGYAQEEPLSLVLRESPRRPPAREGRVPRVPEEHEVIRVPAVISVKPEFSDRALSVLSETSARPEDLKRVPRARPVPTGDHERYLRVPSTTPVKSEDNEDILKVPSITTVRPEDHDSFPRTHPAFSIEDHERYLRVSSGIPIKPEDNEVVLRVPSATSVRRDDTDLLRVPSVSTGPEDTSRRWSSAAEERDRVICSTEEADRVRPEEGDRRAFSVDSLMGDRPGASKSKLPLHQQQRNYKNMTRERRIEANARERTRVHTISAAFDTLRRAVPAYSHNQKLSKLSVLRIACSYILTLSRVAGDDYSADHSLPALADCVENVSRTIQMEGKLRKKRDE